MSNSNMQISATLELIDRISAPLNRIQFPLERTQRAFDQAREAVKNL